jgi:hypothetical protein
MYFHNKFNRQSTIAISKKVLIGNPDIIELET